MTLKTTRRGLFGWLVAAAAIAPALPAVAAEAEAALLTVTPGIWTGPFYVAWTWNEGSNPQDGLSPATAWKHIPGDPAFTGAVVDLRGAA